ncbi:hypothetical protein LEP1GSC193_4139 [Leptospira alstonii serovar Pingchang str. 80-412]|uniref:Uncharacterized protein n=2 Tax=Leptospira alstonii TaxID=28452 RepID=M6CN15_9LEPT|nr:hypothetical protein LEP1GSC194_1793 [Leptospira alstonii serovar Sichuan str. 79601]EQA78382.1 hypothetical protein LEP1GSC193_4139 [Leptospira alstonii serovar Pingchang str. 80-412]
MWGWLWLSLDRNIQSLSHLLYRTYVKQSTTPMKNLSKHSSFFGRFRL